MTEVVAGQWCHEKVRCGSGASSTLDEIEHEHSSLVAPQKRCLARLVVNAAIAATMDQQDLSSEVPSLADSKSASWFALSAALTKATPHAHSSTATPLSDPSLSEVSSSQGGLSPRAPSQTTDAPQDHSSEVTFQPTAAVRWADEELEADTDFFHGCQDESKPSYEQEDVGGIDPATPSKRSRRSNRRRRARLEKTGAMLETQETIASQNSTGRLRDRVTVGDLFGHDSGTNQAQTMRTPQRRGRADEVAWFMPVSPCQVQSGPMGIVSTSPCKGQSFHAEASMRTASGYPQHPIGMLSTHSVCMPQVFGTQAHSVYTDAVPRSPCNTRAGPIVSTSPLATMGAHTSEASTRSPPPLLELSSPCHARGAVSGGIISTSPPSYCHTGTLPPCNTPISRTAPQTTGSEVCTLEPAGSPTADALRSWLHASGLPSSADLAWHLRAIAPETYED